MHVANTQFSEEFNNGRNKIQNGRFIAIFRFLRQYFYLVGTITSKVVHISCSNVYCMLLKTSSQTSAIVAAGYCRVCSCLNQHYYVKDPVSTHELCTTHTYYIGIILICRPLFVIEQQSYTTVSSKRDTLSHCWINVGPSPTTLAQHWSNNGSMTHVWWG